MIDVITVIAFNIFIVVYNAKTEKGGTGINNETHTEATGRIKSENRK